MSINCYACQTVVAATDVRCPQCHQPLLLRNRYRVKSLLGQGGFGVVYEAFDVDLARHYAIKLITANSPAMREQVTVEAQILAQHARHLPFIPEVYDIWSEGNVIALVMEFVSGTTVGSLIETHERLAATMVEHFLTVMLSQLAQLHALNIIHRDIKPENIKRTADDRLVLLDFGIAKRSQSTETAAKAFSLFYASPEQSRGRATDARSDLYSLGATAYHMLTGHSPVPAESRISGHIRLRRPSELADNVPAGLDALMLQLLELDPNKRPDTAEKALQLLKNPSKTSQTINENNTIRGPQLVSSAGKATIALNTPSLAEAPAAKSKARWYIGILGLLVVVGLIGTQVMLSMRSAGAADSTATAQVIAIINLPSTEPTANMVPTTSEPTIEPTVEPSQVPPTIEPTIEPSQVPPTAEPTIEPTQVLAPEISQLADLINQFRSQNGLPPLLLQPQVQSVAQAHSDDMANNNYFSNSTPAGQTIGDLLRQANHISSFWNVHISAGHSNAQAAFDALINDPGLQADLLSPNISEFGIGHAQNAQATYGHYWVVVYSQP
ncbi:protein kinase domain-containing protein [Herpetosiphon giganteus]|uniref:protein kinase domain-containing protein n=1 Tax=Herpetosiphon giganteus TaxID=2029754 RepID=UPI00195AADEC|nr:protein kinase [Herpetosiphon giganteus]MBM7845731.1 serine/threonine-protein kinase [Herpetosiphon giganteus]